MVARFWGSLASREAVPVPCRDQKPCRFSWYKMANVRRRFRIPNTFFHNTLTSMIPHNPMFPLGSSTIVLHVHSSGKDPSRNAACMRKMTFC